MKYYTIYKTTNIINNSYYIGSHITENPNDSYLGSGKLILEAIKKYGKENFKKEIICYCKNEEDLDKIEEQLVITHKEDPMSYNIERGGNRPPRHDKAPPIQWGNKHVLGKTWKGTENQRLSTSKRLKGISKPREQVEKMILNRIDKGMAERNAMASEENRKKVSNSKIGRKAYHDPITKKRISTYPGQQPIGYVEGWI